jgi:hypothetical protein
MSKLSSIPVRQRRALKQGFLVYRKADGYQVLRQSDHRSDCLSFTEGVLFRLGFGLPKRILQWPSPDGSTLVMSNPIASIKLKDHG